MLLEISAKVLVDLAELAASYVTSKASMWTHFQMKEPSSLSKYEQQTGLFVVKK